MTANLPTDAIEERLRSGFDFERVEHFEYDDERRKLIARQAEAKSQLRAIKDAALVARGMTGAVDDVRVDLGQSLLPHKTRGRVFAHWKVEQCNDDGLWLMVAMGPIVNGLPVLTDEARRALGET